MMDRADMERWLNDYLDGVLSANDREQVTRRIAEDPAWAKEHAQLKAIRDRASAMPRGVEPPRDLWPGIEAKIRRVPEPQVRRRFRSFFPQWAPTGIALAAAVILAILMRPDEGSFRSDRTDGFDVSTRTEVLPATVEALDYECRGAGRQLVASANETESAICAATTASIQEDLHLLESAIEQTRAALEENPDDTRVFRILTELYEQKLSLLHRAMQISRMA